MGAELRSVARMWPGHSGSLDSSKSPPVNQDASPQASLIVFHNIAPTMQGNFAHSGYPKSLSEACNVSTIVAEALATRKARIFLGQGLS